MRVADYIAATLAQRGVRPLFLITGGRRGYLVGLAAAGLVELLGATAVHCAAP